MSWRLTLLSEAISRRQQDEDLWRRWQSLSPREQQVAALTCLNYTNPQIAARLGVAVETVRTHSRNVQIKFNIRSKSDLRVLLSEWDFNLHLSRYSQPRNCLTRQPCLPLPGLTAKSPCHIPPQGDVFFSRRGYTVLHGHPARPFPQKTGGRHMCARRGREPISRLTAALALRGSGHRAGWWQPLPSPIACRPIIATKNGPGRSVPRRTSLSGAPSPATRCWPCSRAHPPCANPAWCSTCWQPFMMSMFPSAKPAACLLSCLRELERLCRGAPVVVSLSPPLLPERAFLVESVCSQAGRVFSQGVPDPCRNPTFFVFQYNCLQQAGC
jgi:DNA-binding CsgD family transcriptional regulator